MRTQSLFRTVILLSALIAGACERAADSQLAGENTMEGGAVAQSTSRPQASQPMRPTARPEVSAGSGRVRQSIPMLHESTVLEPPVAHTHPALQAGTTVPEAGRSLIYEERENAHSASGSHPKDISEAMREFRANPDGLRLEAARMLRPLLKWGMTKREVEEMLGPPRRELSSESAWHYDVFWSHAMSIVFDANGRVEHVKSTFKDAATSNISD